MDKWLKKPVAKKRKHGEFSYFSYINYMTIYSHKFLTVIFMCEIHYQSTMEVCEDFLGYIRLEKCDAESIAGVITETSKMDS